MRLRDGRRLYSHAEFGRNDHREDAPHFIVGCSKVHYFSGFYYIKILQQNVEIQAFGLVAF